MPITPEVTIVTMVTTVTMVTQISRRAAGMLHACNWPLEIVISVAAEKNKWFSTGEDWGYSTMVHDGGALVRHNALGQKRDRKSVRSRTICTTSLRECKIQPESKLELQERCRG